MKSGIDEREHLFHKINPQLRKWDSNIGDKIYCPLCWQQFEFESLHSFLSIEHVPPSSVIKLIDEKYYITLTCKKCNHEYGSKYHSQLNKFLICQLHQNGKYDQPIKGEISIPSAGLVPLKSNISLTTKDIKIKMAGVPKANAPSLTQGYISFLNETTNKSNIDWSFNVTLNYGFVLSTAWSAYIQVAYLLVYILTGGYYAFTKAGREIRERLICGEINKIGPCVVIPSVIVVGGKPWVARIVEPLELRCLWVKIAGNIVIMPFPEDDKLLCYSAWQRVSKQTNFGLSPENVHLKINFHTVEDALEANKCVKLSN